MATAFAAALLFAWRPLPLLTGLSTDTLLLMQRSQTLPPARPRVIVVAIDEQTLLAPEFADRPRVLWTALLAETIDALVANRAKVIGFDLIFTTTVEQDLPDFDRPFRLSLRSAAQANKLVMAEAATATEPISPHAGQIMAVGIDNVSAINLPRDHDGVVRRVNATAPTESGEYIRTFSAEIATRAGARINPAEKEVLINWTGSIPAVPTYGLAEFLRCARMNKLGGVVADSVVLIGTILPGEDRLRTPLRLEAPRVDVSNACAPSERRTVGLDGGDIPGVYVQAAAINTFLLNNRSLEIALTDRFALLTLLCAASAYLSFQRSLVEAPALLAIGIVWTVLCMWLANAGTILPWLDGIAAESFAWAGTKALRVGLLERGKRQLREAFGKFLSPEIVVKIEWSDRPPALSGEMRIMTVLMTDIENYTRFSSTLSPQDVVRVLNRLYSVIVEEVEAHGGFVAHYVGDATVSFFGAPHDDPDHCLHAVQAAAAIAPRLSAIEKELSDKTGVAIRTRFGINAGELIVGNVGSDRRMNYTAIGNAINLAQRIEQANKDLGTTIAASEHVARATEGAFFWRDQGEFSFKGVDQPTKVLTLVGHNPAASNGS